MEIEELDDLPEQMPDTKNVTIKDLDELCKQLKIAKDEKDSIEAQLTEKNKQIAQLSGKIVAHMREHGRDEYPTPFGRGVITQKWTVTNPQSLEDKKLFFDHLRERGIFDQYATVNNKSLNSLYKHDWEEAKKQGKGMEFSLPGIGAPRVFEDFDFKKPKKKKGETVG